MILSWFRKKAQYKQIAYGWPEYSTVWHIYEYDEKNNQWRITRDDLFSDPRPDKYDITMRLMNFAKDATSEQRETVNKMIQKKFTKQ